MINKSWAGKRRIEKSRFAAVVSLLVGPWVFSACVSKGDTNISGDGCGNGQLAGNEACDDGNGMNGDGCDQGCQIETGWTCPEDSRCVRVHSGQGDAEAQGTDSGGSSRASSDAATDESPSSTEANSMTDASHDGSATDVRPPDNAGSDTSDAIDGDRDEGSRQRDASVGDPDAATALSSVGTVDAGSPRSDSGGSQGDGGNVEAKALLDGESTGAYACEVRTEAMLLDVPSGFDAALVGVGDTVWYARGEAPSDGSGSSSLELSTLGLDATLGEAIPLGSSEFDSFYSTQIAATPAGLLIFTLRFGTGGAELYLAAVTNEGVVNHSVAVIEGIANTVDNYALSVGSDEVALLYSSQEDSSNVLYYATLDFEGTLLGEPKLVRRTPDGIYPGAITATSQGYLFSYVMGYHPSSLFVQSVEGAKALGAEIPIATNPNLLSPAHSMLVHDSEVLFAWTDTGGSWDNSDLHRTTMLSRLDSEGKRATKDVRVQRPVASQERVSPKLLEHDGSVGLLWSEGSVFYICAGCMPDNHLNFVMLDGATLAPSSETLTLTNPASDGGLIAPVGVWRGDDLSVVAAVAYHTSGEGAAGTITCEAR